MWPSITRGSRSIRSSSSTACAIRSNESRRTGWRRAGGRPVVLAYGRDPHFAGWPDTLQLDYRREDLRDVMTGELARVAGLCDGVRCDMAMLVQPDVFLDVAGRAPADGRATPVSGPFWRGAIARVREAHPDFMFMAEVYWDREWELQQEGFDFTYDKRLYDRLHRARGTRCASISSPMPTIQARSTRFLENHDEPRAAEVFPLEVHRAAAVITFLVPGMRFFHEGQREGRRVHVSMHVGRRPAEPLDAASRVLRAPTPVLGRPEVHDGEWSCRRAGPGGKATGRARHASCSRGRRRAAACSSP